MVNTLFICKELSAGAIMGVKCDYEKISTACMEKLIIKNYSNAEVLDQLIAGGNIESLAATPENTCFYYRDLDSAWRSVMPIKILMFDPQLLFYIFTQEGKWVKYKKGKKYILGDNKQWNQ